MIFFLGFQKVNINDTAYDAHVTKPEPSKPGISRDLSPCFFQLALPGERILSFGSGETRLNVTNQLHVIPGTEGNISISSSLLFDAPLYWQLPREFKRDKVGEGLPDCNQLVIICRLDEMVMFL